MNHPDNGDAAPTGSDESLAAPPSSERTAAPGWVWWVAKVLLFVFSMFVGKVGVYQQNNFIEMPLVLKQLDPQLYPNDSFVNALQVYPIPMWHWIFPLFKLGSTFSVLWTLTFLLRIFVFWAAGRLALALTNGNRLAEIAAWAVFAAGIEPPVAAGTVYPYTFEHTSLSIGCLLLATTFFFKRKPLGFALMIGCAGFLNLLYGLQALVYLGVMCLASREFRGNFLTYLKWLPIAVVLMLPAFAMAFQNLSLAKLPGDEFSVLSRFNYPGHFFPSSWSVLQWARLALAAVAMLALAKWARLDRNLRVAFAASTAVMAFFIFLAYVGADVMGSSFFISTQPARAADFWFAFASVSMAAYFGKETAEAESLGAVATPLGALFLTIAFWRYGYDSDTSTGMVLAAVGGTLVFLGIGLRFAKSVHFPVPVMASLGALLLVFAIESGLNVPRMRGPDGSLQIVQTPYGNQTALYTWISANTPKSARFLVFPNAEDFRALAQRTPFFTPNEGAAMMWDETFGLDWAARLHALGVAPTPESGYPVYITEIESFYEQHMDDRLAEQYANRANIDYAVYASSWQTSLSVVYDDGRWKLVKLR